jgi:glycosyltransferase involved in cell wall biosynthesis
MNLAVLTPLPPARSGIAHYASILLPALARHHGITAVTDQADFESPRNCEAIRSDAFEARRGEFDAVLYQLGNNPHHEFAYREAMALPGVVVLHDLVLHHLIVESTLARGARDDYVEQIRSSHGPPGAALARGRVAGFHGEIGNFLYPASVAVAERSRSVIVHNRYAAESLRRLGVTRPIVIVGHPHVPSETAFDAARVRRRLGYGREDVVVGVFGFLTEAKRPQVVFEAFHRALRRNDKLRLLVVGEPAPNVDIEALARRFELPSNAWRALGYVADKEFDEYLSAVDKVVNLRYPSAGETSGALIRVFAAGKPVAVSDYAQFAELPEAIATPIPFGPDEVELLSRFLLERDSSRVVTAQKEWLRSNAGLDSAVAGYLRALAGENDVSGIAAAPASTVPVLAQLRLLAVRSGCDQGRWRVQIELENQGPTRLLAGVYGAPGYRILAKVFDRSDEIFDQWIALPRDLSGGTSAWIELEFWSEAARPRLELSHAIEGVPHFDFAPFATAELSP